MPSLRTCLLAAAMTAAFAICALPAFAGDDKTPTLDDSAPPGRWRPCRPSPWASARPSPSTSSAAP
ncbi:MAG: hypothetical protein WDN06_12240 [Asticcacaulis sp.]